MCCLVEGSHPLPPPPPSTPPILLFRPLHTANVAQENASQAVIAPTTHQWVTLRPQHTCKQKMREQTLRLFIVSHLAPLSHTC